MVNRAQKCDLQRDVCGQCSRAGIECFGRLDPNELIILDQTISTKQKFMACQEGIATIHSLITPALEVHARSAFFSHYVFGFSRSQGALAALHQTTAPDSPLSAAVDAAALLFLAKHYQAPGYHAKFVSSPTHQGCELMRLATASYVVATKRLRSALHAASLSSPESAKNVVGDSRRHSAYGDETLQAVLLLDLYEKLAVTGITRSPGAVAATTLGIDEKKSWMSHIQGALSLLRAGNLEDHLESPVKRRLAARLAMALVVSCGIAGVHVPRTRAAARWAHERQHGQVMDSSIMRLDPKFAVTNVVIHSRKQKLDQQFIEMEQAFPSSWQYGRVIANSMYPMVYGGYYDIYADHFVTQVRNVVRTMRLLLARIEMGYSDTAISSLYHGGDVRTTVERFCDNIVASVPQFTRTLARPQNRIPFSPLQSLQCFTLLGPMYLVEQLTTRSELRGWIITTLECLAESGGLHMAKTVARILRSAPETNYWHVYSLLGSYAFAA
ncbi:hypothetical protein PG994_013669 [Apiospora phragmitis]|uniref:Uncharacterized protein n=1 Tax=Apiospora phragmitis TaxID=2905665 RepID=A0ABR1T9A8_9PEZI